MDHSKNKSNFPDGDILFNYHPDDSPHKFDYLKGKYVFRFPFTLTSIKWGLSLGLFFGLHTYFKKSPFYINLFIIFLFRKYN